MAIKLRLADVSQFGRGDQATLLVNIEAFDDANDQVIDREVLQYSLAAFDAQESTNAKKLARIRRDAEAWGQGLLTESAITQKLTGLVGTVITIPPVI